MLSRAH
jgi:chromosome segregation ATPase